MAAFTCAHRTYGFPFLPQAVGTPWIHDFAQKRLAPGDVVHVILSGTRLALHAKYIASVFYLSPSRLHVSAIFESRAAIFHSHTSATVGWLSILFCGLLLLSPYHSMCLNFGFPSSLLFNFGFVAALWIPVSSRACHHHHHHHHHRTHFGTPLTRFVAR